MKLLAQGPVMTERSTIPYCYVLRAEVDDSGTITKYVVHTKLLNTNAKGEVVSVSYCYGYYFAADEKDEAYLYWAKKVLERIEHNVNTGVAY